MRKVQRSDVLDYETYNDRREAFRDMQRHRMLTLEWQPLTPNHGYVRPDLIDAAGVDSGM